MNAWYESLKPRASSRVQLVLAGCMWSVVGALLLFFGAHWVIGSSRPPISYGLLIGAVLLGAAKSLLVLDRAARKIVTRIGQRGEGGCLGGFLSVRSWLVVLVMVGAGRILRSGLLHPAAVGTLYTAIGTALVVSSRVAWQGWLTSGSSGKARR